MAERDLRHTGEPPDPAKSAQGQTAESGPAESGPVESGHVRDKTDAGKFSDKVAAPDPATAPLGTDDEAAGRPTPATSTRTTTPHEPAQATVVHHADHDQPLAKGPLVVIGIVVVAFLIGLVLVVTSG